MSKPTRVEIVQARQKGITGYASLARGTGLGNPYSAKDGGNTDVVESFRVLFYEPLAGRKLRDAALSLLERDWPDGVVRIACPCNGTFKGQPCHASIIKKFIERNIPEEQTP